MKKQTKKIHKFRERRTRMKKNLTIKTEVMNEQWNEEFLEKMKSGDLSSKESYWVETVSKMIDNALNKLRSEFTIKQEEVKK